MAGRCPHRCGTDRDPAASTADIFIGLAARSVIRERSVMLALDDAGTIATAIEALSADARAALPADRGERAYPPRRERQRNRRSRADAATLRAAFARLFAQRFGFSGQGEPMIDMRMADAAHNIPLCDRTGLSAGFAVDGPALIVDPVATTVIEPGWRAEVDGKEISFL